jgi:hypothetical protein
MDRRGLRLRGAVLRVVAGALPRDAPYPGVPRAVRGGAAGRAASRTDSRALGWRSDPAVRAGPGHVRRQDRTAETFGRAGVRPARPAAAGQAGHFCGTELEEAGLGDRASGTGVRPGRRSAGLAEAAGDAQALPRPDQDVTFTRARSAGSRGRGQQGRRPEDRGPRWRLHPLLALCRGDSATADCTASHDVGAA